MNSRAIYHHSKMSESLVGIRYKRGPRLRSIAGQLTAIVSERISCGSPA